MKATSHTQKFPSLERILLAATEFLAGWIGIYVFFNALVMLPRLETYIFLLGYPLGFVAVID